MKIFELVINKRMWLSGGTVPPNNSLSGGTVPPDNSLSGGTMSWGSLRIVRYPEGPCEGVPPDNLVSGGTLHRDLENFLAKKFFRVISRILYIVTD